MPSNIMYSNVRDDSNWVTHPPRTRDLMYSPSQPAVGQNKVLPTITPSPIASLHAKQGYRLDEAAPKSWTRTVVGTLKSQRPPIPVMIPVADLDSDPDFRVAARPSLDRQPSQPRPLPQDVEADIMQRQRPQEARLRQGSEADTPQVSRVFPKRCVPKESQSQPRKGPTYVAPGPSSLRQYIVYQTPSPEVDTSVVSVKTQPIAECVSLSTVPPPDSWIHPALFHKGHRTPLEWDLTQPLTRCMLPAPVQHEDLQHLPAYLRHLQPIRFRLAIHTQTQTHAHAYSFHAHPARTVQTHAGYFVPSLHTFLSALRDALLAPLTATHWAGLPRATKVALAVAMAVRRREALPELVAQFRDGSRLAPGVLDLLMLHRLDAVLDDFVFTNTPRSEFAAPPSQNTRVMKVCGVEFLGERTLFNGVSWDEANEEFRIHTGYPELDHSVISSLYMTFADHIELCDKDAPV